MCARADNGQKISDNGQKISGVDTSEVAQGAKPTGAQQAGTSKGKSGAAVLTKKPFVTLDALFIKTSKDPSLETVSSSLQGVDKAGGDARGAGSGEDVSRKSGSEKEERLLLRKQQKKEA